MKTISNEIDISFIINDYFEWKNNNIPLTEKKEIEDYLIWVKDNPNKINRKNKLLIKNIVIPTLKRNDVFFDENIYDKCIRYCETNYYKLFPYQKFIYAFAFMYKDDIPLFRKFIIEMGRGNGKDGFVMPLLNFLQTPIYGVKNYHIDIVATSEEQSQNSFNVVREMLITNEDKFKNKFYWSMEKIYNYETRSTLRYNTSNAGTKDGKQTGAILFNEYHAYKDRKQIDVFTSGLGKIKHPRIFIITTDGDIRDGVLDKELNICNQILEGIIENTTGYFPFLCTLDDEKEVDNPEMWIKANPSIEYMPELKSEITMQYEETKIDPSTKFEFMTKRMNMPARDEAVSVTSWENILETNKEIPDLSRMSCIGGLDYADVDDFCGVGLLFKKDNKKYWLHHTFICSYSSHLPLIPKDLIRPAIEDGYATMLNTKTIDVSVVVKWFIDMAKIYNIKKIAMDTFRYNMFKEEFEKYGFYPCDNEHKDGRLQLVRNGPVTHNKIAPQISEMFINHNIIWGDDKLMRWYTWNTGVKTDGKGNKTYFKIEYQSRKNDGFMALVHAMTLEDELPKNNNKIIFGLNSFTC